MNNKDRLDRLEKAIVSIRELLKWTNRGDTWQDIWDPLDRIVDSIEEELNEKEI